MEVAQCRCPENTVTARKKANRAFPGLKSGTNMSVSEFTNWLECMDGNGDGVITKPELQKAVKRLDLWFANWKTKKAMDAADVNDDTLIDTDEEFQQLILYAQKHWGLTISVD